MFRTYSRDKSLPFHRSSSKLSSVREASTTDKSSQIAHLHDQIGTVSTPTAVDLVVLQRTRTNVEEGDYFLICEIGKEPMPGVVCNEQMVINLFKHERPDHAKRPDGSYHKDFLPLGNLEMAPTVALLFLLSNSGYVAWHLLRPIDYAVIAQKQDDPITRPSLKRAYSDLLHQYDLDYWKSALLAKSLVEEDPVNGKDSMDEDGSPKMIHRQKRKRTEFEAKGLRFPPTFGAREVEDEEDDDEDQYVKR
ncbi:hypothetical protein MMC15_002380 [Xylographa vitiligo]|nr:hypothetical protein [Xylographa vitiligo]